MSENHQHYVLENKMAVIVFLVLIFGTIITVAAHYMPFGIMHFPIAMLIASTKAYFVCAYFMGLKFDEAANKIYFLGSLLFVAIFILLTAADLFFRDIDYAVPGYAKPIPSEMQQSEG